MFDENTQTSGFLTKHGIIKTGDKVQFPLYPRLLGFIPYRKYYEFTVGTVRAGSVFLTSDREDLRISRTEAVLLCRPL